MTFSPYHRYTYANPTVGILRSYKALGSEFDLGLFPYSGNLVDSSRSHVFRVSEEDPNLIEPKEGPEDSRNYQLVMEHWRGRLLRTHGVGDDTAPDHYLNRPRRLRAVHRNACRHVVDSTTRERLAEARRSPDGQLR